MGAAFMDGAEVFSVLCEFLLASPSSSLAGSLPQLTQRARCCECGWSQEAPVPLPQRLTTIVQGSSLLEAADVWGRDAGFGRLLGHALAVDFPRCRNGASGRES